MAEYLIDNHGDDLKDRCVILPNRRASLFLKKELQQLINDPVWLPVIISSEEFALKHSGLRKLDSIESLFNFYNAYCEYPDPEPFESFVKWAPALLQDFNEIDQYMVDTNDLFTYINEARALEIWSPERAELTDVQKRYLDFWKKLDGYYRSFKKKLLHNNACYAGMGFRYVAENLNEIYSNNKLNDFKQFLFVGFSAFNKAEESIVSFLKSKGKVKLLWDVDEYYYHDDIQEAGLFVRKHIKKMDAAEFLWKTNDWLTQPKSIHLYGVNGDINQTNLASSIVEQLGREELQNVAVVLNDEELLLPLLNSLPENVEHVNVTMGYPLQLTPLHGLWSNIFKLHENAAKYGSKNKSGSYHYKDVIRILNHPFLKTSKSEFIGQQIVEHNWVFISPKKMMELLEDHQNGVWKDIFSHWNDNPSIAIEAIQRIGLKLDLLWTEKQNNKLNKEYIFKYNKVFNALKSLLEKYPVIVDLRTFRYFFDQLIAKETLDFYGEPLAGLQVMGMLETRNLDFDKIIMLSTNEGVIPGGRSGQSFIPFEIKRKFKLPTHIEKDAIFGYHFYRLLQKSNEVHLVYNTDVEGLNSGEKSRFITQILHEARNKNKLITVHEQLLSLKLKDEQHSALEVSKSKEVLDSIANHLSSGLSPSALNTFIRCPLDYYFKYILKLKEEDEVEENIESSTLGTVVHEVLELLYRKYVAKILTVKDVETMEERVDNLVLETFVKNGFGLAELNYGKNNLTFNIAIKFIKDFLQKEVKFLKKLEQEGEYLTIIALEKEISTTIELNDNLITLKGNADRIDKIGNTYRVIDYKTGLVEPKDLNCKEMVDLFNDENYSKALQLMLYGMMFADNENDLKIVPGIISFRKLSEWFMPVKMNKIDFTLDQLTPFQEHLIDKLNDLFDTNKPFVHLESSQYCNFCDI